MLGRTAGGEAESKKSRAHRGGGRWLGAEAGPREPREALSVVMGGFHREPLQKETHPGGRSTLFMIIKRSGFSLQPNGQKRLEVDSDRSQAFSDGRCFIEEEKPF